MNDDDDYKDKHILEDVPVTNVIFREVLLMAKFRNI